MLFKVENIFGVINAEKFLRNVIFKPKALKCVQIYYHRMLEITNN